MNREGNENLKVGKWERALGKKDIRTLILYDGGFLFFKYSLRFCMASTGIDLRTYASYTRIFEACPDPLAKPPLTPSALRRTDGI